MKVLTINLLHSRDFYDTIDQIHWHGVQFTAKHLEMYMEKKKVRDVSKFIRIVSFRSSFVINEKNKRYNFHIANSIAAMSVSCEVLMYYPLDEIVRLKSYDIV